MLLKKRMKCSWIYTQQSLQTHFWKLMWFFMLGKLRRGIKRKLLMNIHQSLIRKCWMVQTSKYIYFASRNIGILQFEEYWTHHKKTPKMDYTIILLALFYVALFVQAIITSLTVPVSVEKLYLPFPQTALPLTIYKILETDWFQPLKIHKAVIFDIWELYPEDACSGEEMPPCITPYAM